MLKISVVPKGGKGGFIKRPTSKYIYSQMLQKSISLRIAAILSLITVVLICIATAGSSANYKPLNNIYIGRAEISRINVTKVIPELENVVDLLGSVLYTYPDQTSLVFGGLRNLSHTSALLPFLTILINSKNNTKTVDAVTSLAPVALLASKSGVSAGSIQGLGLINSLLTDSTNSTETLQGLEGLLAALSANSSPSSSSSSSELVMEMLQGKVFTLLESSNNATATAEALSNITNLNPDDLMQLFPAVELLEDSTDPAATFKALHSLMNVTVSPATADSLLKQLDSVAADATGAKISELIAGASLILPASLDSTIDAVGTLLKSSRNTTEAISLLGVMIKDNITQSTVAKSVMADLATIVDNSKDQTKLFETVSTLMGSLGDNGSGSSSNNKSGLDLSVLSILKSSSKELEQLTNILRASNDTKVTLGALQTLQTSMSGSNSSISFTAANEYVPYLFDFLEASSDPASSFNSLINITEFAAKNLDYFTPVMKILELASRTTQTPTPAELDSVIPIIFQNLDITPNLQLAIFTLCKVNSDNEVYQCNKPHAVQNFDFRQIIYSVLEQSQFQPYLKALDIKAADLHLKGRLQHKEKEYVPAVKAVLAMNLLTIITGFLLAIALLVSSSNKLRVSFLLIPCSLLFCVFSGLGAAILTAMVNIIKRDTAYDDYNVSVESSPAYMGLVWTAFCLALLTVLLVAISQLSSGKRSEIEAGSVGSSDVYYDEKGVSVQSTESVDEVDIVHADLSDGKVKALDV